MSTLIFLQLENTKAMYQSLKSEGRNDPIACMLLSRIENEIKDLKNRHAKEIEKQEPLKRIKIFMNNILKKVVI